MYKNIRKVKIIAFFQINVKLLNFTLVPVATKLPKKISFLVKCCDSIRSQQNPEYFFPILQIVCFLADTLCERMRG